MNGPAIAADGTRAAVAWFTGAEGVPAVKLAFSEDAGLSFGPPARVDLGDPVGRVDVDLLDDGSALVTWVEWVDAGEALMMCRVTPYAGCRAPVRVALNTAGASVNFPRLARIGNQVFLAWTQPGTGGDRLALRRAILPAAEAGHRRPKK